MTYSEIKLWIINTSVLTLTFTDLDNFLKLILLIITIGYSIDKWYMLRKNKKDKDL